MSDDTTTTDETSTETETTEYTIFGWAEVGPSRTIELPADEDIESLSHSERVEYLQRELEDRGFTEEQIQQMNIEVDYVEERL